MTASQEENINNALLDIRRILASQKLTFRDLILPYSRLNTSYIQENDFLRAFKNFPTAPTIARNFANNGLISIYEVEKALNNAISQPPEPPKTPPYIIFTLARLFQRQNVDYWTIFNSRDRLRTGKVDISIFKSLLYSTGIRVNPDDINEIIDFYRVQDKVNYAAFVEDIRKASVAEQEVIRNRTRDPPEDPDINKIIDHIKSICKGRKVLLSGFFEGYESPMTLYTFTRLINSSNLQLNPREINYLAKYCQLANGTVDPSIIINKVDQITTTNTVLADTEDIITKIQHFLEEKQLYLTPRFERFDRERSGEFPVSLINSVLNQYEFPLSDYELDCLQQRYPGSRVPFIKWREFDYDIEPYSLVSQYQQQQTIRKMNESIQKPMLTTEASSHVFRAPEDDQNSKSMRNIPDSIEPLLTEFANYEIKTSISIFDDLRNIDNLRLGFIQPYQFNSYMLTVFPRITRKELDSLIQYYGNKEFMYIDLCKDIKAVKDSFTLSTSNFTNSSNFSQQTTTIPSTARFASSSSISADNLADITDPELNSVIKRIKAFTIKNIIAPIDIFNINDKTGLGFVPSNRLSNCFGLIRFDISQKETNLLLKKFCSPDYPDRFYYLPLVSILDNMKMNPRDVKWLLTPDIARIQVNDSAHQVNCQIHGKLTVRRKNIFDFFFGCPTGRPIDSKEFTNRLRKLDLVLQPFEISILMAKYHEPQDENLINWEQFCNDVQNVKLF